MKIALGSDHGGYPMKEHVKEWLLSHGYEVEDKGCFGRESVDYPDYAKTVCDDVKSGASAFGVLVCTSGIGMSIAANKIRGIRAALCLNADSGKFSRLHNDANVCCLGAKYLQPKEALEIVKIFASTQFEGGRHLRRVQKFMDFENL